MDPSTDWVGGALDFDGSNDEVSLGNIASLEITGDITIFTIFQTTKTTAEEIVSCYRSSPFTGYGLGLNIVTSGKLAYWSNGIGTWQQSASSNYNSGDWVSAAITIFGSGANAGQFYKNGISDGTWTHTSPGASGITKKIGARAYGGNVFLGRINLVYIYSRALTADEIAWLYREPYAMFEAHTPARWFAVTSGGQTYTETGISSTWISALSRSDTALFADTGKSSTWVSTLSRGDVASFTDTPSETWVSVISSGDTASFVDTPSSTWIWTSSKGDLGSFVELPVSSTWVSTLTSSDGIVLLESPLSSTWISTLSEGDTATLRDALSSTWASTLSRNDIAIFRDTPVSTWVSTLSAGDIATFKESQLSTWISTLSRNDGFLIVEGLTSTWVSTLSKSDLMTMRETLTSTWVSVITLSDLMTMLEGRSDTWVWVSTAGDTLVIGVTDDWYNLIESQIITTLNSDSWLGTAGTAVKTREARLRGDYKSYFDSELPAVIAKVVGKRQIHSSTGDFQKFFKFTLYVLTRDGDLDASINTVQEIAAVLEDKMESQYTAENDLSGLGTYSLTVGGPITRLKRTRIAFRNTGKDIAAYEALATLDGEIELVTE